MGDHPQASSEIDLNGTLSPLRDVIRDHPIEFIGKYCHERFGDLPFLFKVLSVGQTLSIQVHPTQEHARRLYAKDPEHYPDPNYKSEIAIALDELIALIGYNYSVSVGRLFQKYPELIPVSLSQKSIKPNQAGLSINVPSIFKNVLQMAIKRPAMVAETASLIHNRLINMTPSDSAEALYQAVFRTAASIDVGLILILLMKIIRLRAGEAIVIKPGIPHAYVRGNLIECMSNSDNVIRMGLTHKYCDLENAVTGLAVVPEKTGKLKPIKQGIATIYDIPGEVFRVSHISWTRVGKPLTLFTNNKPHVFLVIKGKCRISWREDLSENIETGQSIFIPAGLACYKIEPLKKPVAIYQVTVR